CSPSRAAFAGSGCEPERHGLDRRQEPRGILPQTSKYIEELLASADVLMKERKQCPLVPLARCAPRRAPHHVVDAGAQGLLRRPKDQRLYPGLTAATFEPPHLPLDPFAQVRRIRRA